MSTKEQERLPSDKRPIRESGEGPVHISTVLQELLGRMGIDATTTALASVGKMPEGK